MSFPCSQPRPYRHQSVPKPLKDHRYPQVQAIRYRCRACQRTFRHYPEGVSSPAERLDQGDERPFMGFGALLGQCERLLGGLGLQDRQAKSTAWENLQAAGEEAQELRKRRPSGKLRVRAIGANTTVYKIKGKEVTTGMVTDSESGAVLEVEILEGADEEGFKEWLGGLVEELEVEVLISDDDDKIKRVADDLGLKHQVCIAHVRRWVGRRTRELIGEAEGLLARPDLNPERLKGDPQELIEDCLLVKESVRELDERGPPELGWSDSIVCLGQASGGR